MPAVEKFNAQETKSFLKLWGEEKGKELSDLADAFTSGIDLLDTRPFLLSKIFLGSDPSLGQQLFDHLHAVEVITRLDSHICFYI